MLCNSIKISIHVPAWGTTSAYAVSIALKTISIHVPAWGTTSVEKQVTWNVWFQSTFPRGERHTSYSLLFRFWLFQSTFPRGERRYRSFYSYIIKLISIHVPAWGTTALSSNLGLNYGISIHVPAWGTTSDSFFSVRSSCISIHVPAWGTTGKSWIL